jgi:hypothetical protein
MTMRIFLGLVASLFMGEASPVLATDPPPAASPAVDSGQSKAPAAAPVTTAAPNAATPAASTTAAANAPSEISPEEDKKLRSQGYKRVVQHGTAYYCRSEPILGSRFDREVCKTADRMSDEHVMGKQVTDRSQIRTYTSK